MEDVVWILMVSGSRNRYAWDPTRSVTVYGPAFRISNFLLGLKVRTFSNDRRTSSPGWYSDVSFRFASYAFA